MNNFALLAKPWWVNLFILVPFIAYYFWRKEGLAIKKQTLVMTGVFGAAFGFVEAAVVIYLRAAVGLLPGYGRTFSDAWDLSNGIYMQADILAKLPASLFAIEFFREAATMIMLAAIAMLSARGRRERWGIYLWVFAAWDIFYYAGLWAMVRWPSSLFTPDILFLIPVPWFAQVWFPLLVSLLTVVAVLLRSDLMRGERPE